MEDFGTSYINRKISLILKDYEAAFQCNDRHFDRISYLRTWTIMSFVLIIGADKGLNIFFNQPILTSIILSGCIVMFWVQEANERVSIKKNLMNVREIEVTFMEKDNKTFDKKIDLYRFRDLEVDSNNNRVEQKNLFWKYFFRKFRVLWYGGLLILAAIAPYATHHA